jgi:hypothetical protein
VTEATSVKVTPELKQLTPLFWMIPNVQEQSIRCLLVAGMQLQRIQFQRVHKKIDGLIITKNLKQQEKEGDKGPDW